MRQPIVVGRIAAAYGIKGWVKVFSYTEPRQQIFSYAPWLVDSKGEVKPVEVMASRVQGKVLVAQLAGISTREQAEAMAGAKINVDRSQFQPLQPGEYYWSDLIGMKVTDLEGRAFGEVKEIMETGANDVLVIQGENQEILVPWIKDRVIKNVDLEAGLIQVDWDPDY